MHNLCKNDIKKKNSIKFLMQIAIWARKLSTILFSSSLMIHSLVQGEGGRKWDQPLTSMTEA